MRNTQNTKIYELKDKFEKQFNSYYNLTKDLLDLKQTFDINSKEDIYVSKNADCIATSFITTVLLKIWDSSKEDHLNKIIDAKKLLKNKEILEDIDLYNYGTCEIDSNQILNGLKNLIKNESGNNKYVLETDLDNFKWSKYEDFCGEPMLNPVVETSNGEIKCNISIKDKIQSYLNNDLMPYAVLIASFLNLGWSIYNLNEINKEIKNLNEYDKEFNSIKNDFIKHKQLLQELPDDIEEAINYINNIYSDIKNDRERLNDYIKKIIASKTNLESIKKQSLLGMGVSTILSFFSIRPFLNGSLLNTISLGMNCISGYNHFSNYEKSKDLIIKLNQRLEDAKKQSEEINKFCDQLMNELEKRRKKIPNTYTFQKLQYELEQEKKKKSESFEIIDGKFN